MLHFGFLESKKHVLVRRNRNNIKIRQMNRTCILSIFCAMKKNKNQSRSLKYKVQREERGLYAFVPARNNRDHNWWHKKPNMSGLRPLLHSLTFRRFTFHQQHAARFRFIINLTRFTCSVASHHTAPRSRLDRVSEHHKNYCCMSWQAIIPPQLASAIKCTDNWNMNYW